MFAVVQPFESFKKKEKKYIFPSLASLTVGVNVEVIFASSAKLLRAPLDNPLRRVAMCSGGDHVTRLFCLTSTKIMPPLKRQRGSAVFINGPVFDFIINFLSCHFLLVATNSVSWSVLRASFHCEHCGLRALFLPCKPTKLMLF